MRRERSRERRRHALGHRDGAAGVGEALAQDDELVAAEAGHRVLARPGHRVAGAQRLRQASRDLHEEVVREGLAEALVDETEVVQVGEDDGGRGVVAPGAREGVAQPIPKEDPIRQARQRVMQHQLGQPLLGVPALLLDLSLVRDVTYEDVEHVGVSRGEA